MKKLIANRLKEIANALPLVFEWEQGTTIMKGWELNLTPLADSQTFEKDRDYVVAVPQMRALMHEQQLKDAYKKEGEAGIKKYVVSVCKKEIQLTP